MAKKIVKIEKNFDATNQNFGRLASAVAFALQGKDLTDYQPFIMSQRIIIVNNLNMVKFTGRKLENKKYIRHTGYAGGIKKNSLKNMFTQSPEKLFRNTVLHMLPNNKSLKKLILNLKINK